MTVDLAQIDLPGLPAPAPAAWRRPQGPQGGQRPPLGSLADSVGGMPSPTPQERVERAKLVRRKGYELLGMIQRITTRKRVAGCCRNPVAGGGMVEVREKGGVGYLAHLQRCANVWVCPVCASKIAGVRRAEIERVGALHVARGGSIASLTLTTRHDAGMNGRALRQVVADAWRSVQQNRAFRAAKKSLGLVGFCRAFEVTYGQNGFHPHIHLALFFDRAFPDRVIPDGPFQGERLRNQELEKFGEVVFQAWREAIRNAGYPEPSKERGINLQVMRPGSGAWLRYLTKIGFEFAGTRHKQGRHGSRSMWQVAEDAGQAIIEARATGEPTELVRSPSDPTGVWTAQEYPPPRDHTKHQWTALPNGVFEIITPIGEVLEIRSLIPDVQVWREFEAMIFGARQLEWSRGMRARYQVDVQTDLEIIDAPVNGTLVVGFPKAVWKQVRAQGTGALADLLEAAARGPASVWQVLDSWGLDVTCNQLLWPAWVTEDPGGG